MEVTKAYKPTSFRHLLPRGEVPVYDESTDGDQGRSIIVIDGAIVDPGIYGPASSCHSREGLLFPPGVHSLNTE